MGKSSYCTDSHKHCAERENGTVLFSAPIVSEEAHESNLTVLNIKDIYKFVEICDLNDVQQVLERQIQMNTNISQEGLQRNYGANIGKVLLKAHGNMYELGQKPGRLLAQMPE